MAYPKTKSLQFASTVIKALAYDTLLVVGICVDILEEGIFAHAYGGVTYKSYNISSIFRPLWLDCRVNCHGNRYITIRNKSTVHFTKKYMPYSENYDEW